MTDDTDPTTEPADATPDEERLEELAHRTEALRQRAEDDLTPGGAGRTFADQGVRAQVAEHGDTDHPAPDARGDD